MHNSETGQKIQKGLKTVSTDSSQNIKSGYKPASHSNSDRMNPY